MQADDDTIYSRSARICPTDPSYFPLPHCGIMSLYNEQELADHKRYSQI
jgi:hypothetical protein